MNKDLLKLKQDKTNEKILRLEQVKQRTGMSRSHIYSQIKKGLFPRQVSLGARSCGWVESEISAFIAERIAARDEAV